MKKNEMNLRQKNAMRFRLQLLIVFFLPGFLFSQGSCTVTKTILGHNYRFVTDTVSFSDIYLRILNENDSVLLGRSAVISGGDCNYHMNEACGYELKGDHLFVYTYKHDSDSYEHFPGIVTYLAMKEEYVFQKSGKLVRIGLVSGGEGTPVWEEVNTKISREIHLAETEG